MDTGGDGPRALGSMARAQLIFQMSDNHDLRALHALPVLQPRGRRTFLEEEEAKETAARQDIGDSDWLGAVRAALANAP